MIEGITVRVGELLVLEKSYIAIQDKLLNEMVLDRKEWITICSCPIQLV